MSTKELLKDNDTDTKLKNYFKKMIDFVGSDYALISVSSEETIKDSLSAFSSSFDDISNIDLTFSFLKSAILSNDTNNKFIRDFLNIQDFGSLAFLINENMGVRRAIARGFIKHCNESNESVYSKSDNQDLVLEQLSNLKSYEDTVSVTNNNSISKVKRY